MRNRGVEIYILNQKDEVNEQNQLDTKSLIDLEGLKDANLIESLIKIHQYLSDLTLGEKPHITELLQASSLISQQLNHGTEIFEAFFRTAIEIYYKTRSSAEFSCNDPVNVIKEEIKRILNEQMKLNDSDDFDLYNENVTMKTKNIEHCSDIEKIKQQSAILQQCSDKNEKYGILINSLTSLYSVTSISDLNIRHMYIRNNFSDRNIHSFVDNLYKIASNAKKITCGDLPLDYRWVPEISYKNHDISESNKLNLALYMAACFHKEKFTIETMKSKNLKQKPVTLLDYMHEKQKKRVEDKFNNVIINEYLGLLDEFDRYLTNLSDQVIALRDTDVIYILYMISWRFIFHKCTLVNIKNLTGTDQYNIMVNLAVHYKWFLKFAVQKVEAISKVRIPLGLKKKLDIINANLEREFFFMQKIGKNYQRFSNVPPPYINAHQLDVMPVYNKISDFYNVCHKQNDPLKIIGIFKNDAEIRALLVELKTELDYNFTDMSKKIAHLQFLHEKHQQIPELEKRICKFEMQLFPIIDYYVHKRVKNIMRKIPKIEDIDVIKNNILVPTDLSGALSMYVNTQDIRLLHEITKCLYFYLMNSASVKPSKYLNYGEDESQELCLSSFSPKLTYYLSFLLNNSSVGTDSGTIKLGNFRQLSKQHRHLSLILWGNLHQLSEEKYNYLHNEKAYVIRMYTIFMVQLLESLNTDDTEGKTVNEITNKCIEKIKELKMGSNLTDPDNDMLKCIKHLQNCSENITKLSKTTNVDNVLLLISDLYMELSYIKATFNSKLSLIDPLAKKALKKIYSLSAIDAFSNMKKCYELQNEIYSNSNATLHAYCEPLERIIMELGKRNEELGKYVAVRSQEVLYETVLKVVSHAFTTILSEKYVNETSSILNSHIFKLIDSISLKEDVDYKVFIDTLNQKESTVASYENLVHEWNNFRNTYPDIIQPLLSNLGEFLYGLKLKLALLKKLIGEYEYVKLGENIQENLTNLVRFPVISDSQGCYNKHVQNYTSNTFKDFINCILENRDLPRVKNQETFRLLRCGIKEMFNLCVLDAKGTDILNKNLFMRFNELVGIFVSAWNKQLEEKELQEREAESLYKTKTKCDDKPEEQQIEEELKELFPNFHDIDFQDFQKNVELKDSQEPSSEEQYKEIISYDDLQFVIRLHMILVQNYTKTEWLNPNKNRNITYDFIEPLLEKHKVFKHILDQSINYTDYTMDNKLISSFSVILAVKQNCGETGCLVDPTSPTRIQQKKSKDFYKDANVEEVKSCYHILEELKLKIDDLLDEWPDQPTLKTIISVIERIYNFDIRSPISRFLTGFEILLSKCHEWEEVAHSGVSLSQYYQNITQQIIHWRKLELTMWKDLLNRTYERLNEPLGKWWLYMYNIMQQFIVEKKFTEIELIETLQAFITKSNLAEFQGRLDILYAFHCHSTYLDNTKESKLFTSILWNVYCYFQQFTLTISNKIKDLRSPIEKKLKDYVKIVKWKDISYWAIKETVDKSHKTLHKYMREFQEVLLQPVSSYLVNSTSNNETENIGIWDRPQRQSPKTYHYTLDPEAYMAKQSLVKKTSHTESSSYSGILSKTESYFLKCRKLCRDTILSLEYPNLVQTLDIFVTEIIETSTHLQNLEVDTTLPKEKQKSQAKNILQQKHRALADLFKTLSKIGLSFRTGIIEAKLKDLTSDYLLKPIDLSANFAHINHGRKEEKILTIWDACEVYYVRSLLRIDTLETAMKNPARDLGLQNIERCKGFTSHLMNLAQKQKAELIESTRIYYYLRYYLKQLNDFCEGQSFLHIDVIENTKDLLKNVIITMEQSKVILNSCPSQDSLTDDLMEIPLLKCESDHIEYKHDALWSKAVSFINEILTTANKLNNHLHKCKNDVPSVDYELVKTQYIAITDVKSIEDDLISIRTSLKELKLVFGNTALTESFTYLMAQINIIEEQFEKRYSTDNIDIEPFKRKVEKFAEKNLIIVQNLYKKYSTNEARSESNDSEEEKQLQDGHLNMLLVKNISSDLLILDMKKILKSTHKLSGILLQTPPDSAEELKNWLYPCLPLLEQTLLLYQYFITQQVSTYRIVCKMTSILLNIFIELTTKGFCVPPEFSEEMEGEGVSKPSDGLGLGEGEGEKDVSDKIESEDQLHDAEPAGKEKEKDEDKDCKEEEKGIEMSEDFDSKLQDKEKKEDDEDDSDSGDSDADEQMGETEKGADQLDQEIWGSDKEEEGDGEEEGSDQKEERGEKGEKEGEDQLGAKERKPSEKDTKEQDDQTSSEDKEKDKKDINEMEEPEYDDDQIDPHHGQQPEHPEPEPMDLPDDLNLDDGQGDENDNENQEENPFDIDTMKEQNIPEEKLEEKEESKDETQNDEEKEFSSDDEDITKKGNEDDEAEREENEGPDEDNEENKDVSESEKPELEKEEHKDQGEKVGLDETQTNEEHVEAMEVDDALATDKTEANQSETLASNQPIDELCQEDKPDKEGIGQSQMEESKTGHSAQTNVSQEIKSTRQEMEENQMKKQKPGESNLKRSLGDTNEPVKKKLKTIESENTGDDQDQENDDGKEQDVDMYQHIEDAKEAATQVLDVATKEQAEQQKQDVPNKEDEDAEKPPESSVDLLSDEEPENVDVAEAQPEKIKENEKSKEKKSTKKQHPEGDILEDIQEIDVEGDVIETTTVPRSAETTHHTQYSNVLEAAIRLSPEEINNLRSEVENQLSSWNEPPSSAEADQMWQKISSVTSSLAQDLSEQLRLVLEPTQASRLRGDFRSGRRINMRKVIPYIASQFRKDKIWLRRTKPSKREYQIILAIDDSSSMADNHSKELAFESVSLISKALTLLESGQLSVVSFGESVEVLHKLTDQFTDRSGVKLLQKFRFDQNKTCVAKLVDFCTEMFAQSQTHSTALNARLLVVVSDGRGVFSEGETYVKQAVRRAKLSNIFMVFVIIDNPENKSSVLDIRMPVFKDGKLLGIQTYMDVFPFSFYIILRDINSLPSVLSDALRQWFEVVSNLDK